MTDKVTKATKDRPCEGSIPLVPFRYALMPKEPEDKKDYYYQDCPTALDKGFKTLKTAAYSVRTLRPGYIYLYDEDKKTTYLWETDGEGNFVSLKWSSLEDYGKESNHGSKMQNITVCDQSNNVYIAYSPDLWSRKGVSKNIANRTKFMTKLNVQEILNGSKKDSTQEHILPSENPEQWIEEYKVSKNNYAQQFAWSSYTPESIVDIDNLKNFANQYAEMHQAKLPVFMVLYDNLATATDQGNIAALHTHQLSAIKQKQTPSKVEKTTEKEVEIIPAEMLLDTGHLSSLDVEFHRKKMISELIHSSLRTTYPSPEELKSQGSRIRNLSHATELAKETLRYSHSSTARTVGDNEARLYAVSNSHMNEDSGRLTKHIKMDELKTFNKELDQEKIRMDAIVAKVLKATNDHKELLLKMEMSHATHPRNIASTLLSYDRDNLYSATALETAIGTSLQGIGIPVPGNADRDQRYKLLEKWAEDENSPIFMGVRAFNAYDDKIDSLADSIGAVGDIAGEMGDKFRQLFPYSLGTEIIVNEVTAYTFKKINGKTRWNKSKAVLRNVDEALQGSNLQKLFKAIAGRYNLTNTSIANHTVTKSYLKIINTATPSNVTQSVAITGTRTTTVTRSLTTTSQQVSSINGVIKTIRNASLPAGVTIFHSINLHRALQSFTRDDSVANSLNLGSALFGFVGAFNEAAVLATRNAMMKKIIGDQTKKRMYKLMASTAAKKFLGYGGAAMEAMVHAHDAWNLGGKGDKDAAIWAGTAALTLGGGGALITAALTGAALSASIPVAGWIAAGALLIVAGLGALYMKMKATDRPLEVWVSRTVFGIHRTNFFGTETDTPFKDLSEEMAGYYNLTFSPLKISEATDILKDENGDWAETDWEENGLRLDQAKFTFLLPGYNEKVSEWSYRLDNYDEDGIDSAEDLKDATPLQMGMDPDHIKEKQDNAGRYIYLAKTFSNSSAESATLVISYWPNGYNKDPVVNTFYLDE